MILLKFLATGRCHFQKRVQQWDSSKQVCFTTALKNNVETRNEHSRKQAITEEGIRKKCRISETWKYRRKGPPIYSTWVETCSCFMFFSVCFKESFLLRIFEYFVCEEMLVYLSMIHFLLFRRCREHSGLQPVVSAECLHANLRDPDVKMRSSVLSCLFLLSALYLVSWSRAFAGRLRTNA
jgi:hypothetical protein